MGAIGEGGQGDQGRRVRVVYDLPEGMSENSIAFRHNQSLEQRNAEDLSKRSFLFAGVLGAVVAPLIKMNHTKAVNKGKASLIRPPGAVDEAEFVCALYTLRGVYEGLQRPMGCIAVLLRVALRACGALKLIPRLGYCYYGCVLCTRVCPSGALRRLG